VGVRVSTGKVTSPEIFRLTEGNIREEKTRGKKKSRRNLGDRRKSTNSEQGGRGSEEKEEQKKINWRGSPVVATAERKSKGPTTYCDGLVTAATQRIDKRVARISHRG